MSEFNVIIYNKENLPIGYLDVYLFDHCSLKYQNGDPVIEWKVRSFPIKFPWLSIFGNLENELNRYIQKEYMPKAIGPDVIVNPVTKSEATDLTEKFAFKLKKLSYLWDRLAICWPNKSLLLNENRLFYFNFVIEKYEILYKSRFNYQHFELDKKPFETIAWDVLIRGILIRGHSNAYETTKAENETPLNEHINNTGEPKEFISFEEISKQPPLYDPIFNFHENHRNLNALIKEILGIYEINEDVFIKEVKTNYDFDRSTARFYFIPIVEEIVNSGVYMLLEGDQTKLIFFSIFEEHLQDFSDEVRYYIWA